jgi:carbon storage regulator
MEIKGRQVRLGIEAPPQTPIHRQEIFLKIKEANELASAADAGDLDRLSGLLNEKGQHG